MAVYFCTIEYSYISLFHKNIIKIFMILSDYFQIETFFDQIRQVYHLEPRPDVTTGVNKQRSEVLVLFKRSI